MKQLFFILVLTAAAMSASAKIVVVSADNAATANHKMKQNSLFDNTKTGISNDRIVFDGLPKKATEYYVLDANGHTKLSGTLSRENNALKLPGDAFTVILKQGKNTKIFGWLKGAVVNGKLAHIK